MSVSLRFTRMGKKKFPFYRLVAVDSRKARDGAYLEKLGHFDPMVKDSEKQVVLNIKRILHWLKVGAQPSKTVSDIFHKNGILKTFHDEKLTEKKASKPKKKRKKQTHAMAEKLKSREESKFNKERSILKKLESQKKKEAEQTKPAEEAKQAEKNPSPKKEDIPPPTKENTQNKEKTTAI